MHVFSTVKPQPHLADPMDDRDLEALGLEIMVESKGVIVVLLIRYFSLDPVKVEGDHLFYSLEELIIETENYYQVPRDKWKLPSDLESGELNLKVLKAAGEIFQASKIPVKFCSTDEEYFSLYEM